MKKLQSKSEYWPFVKVFGVISLFMILFLLMHLVHHEIKEAFVTAIVVAIPVTLTIYLALTPEETVRATWRPETIDRAKEEALRDSFLDPSNIPPDKLDPPRHIIG